MTEERFTVAPGTRLLHIGPYKTGTTALQGAFHRARETLAAHGVVYAGRDRQAKRPAVALTSPTGPREPWEELCREAAAAGGSRVVVSSEFFCDADAAAAREAVRGLGAGPGGTPGGRRDVHVVVTLRPLLKILPSHWQQYVKHGLRDSYEQWLDGVLRRPERCSTPEFWHRHRHDALLVRWMDAAGPDDVTVVVTDETAPRRIFRTFEGMLGLPDGLLVPEEDGVNRSLTAAQAELLLRLNRRLAEDPVLDAPRQKVVREGIVPQLQAYRPSRDEPRIATPAWAQQAAAEVAGEMAEAIAKLGVRVLGDLSALTPPPGGPTGPVAPEAAPVDAAVEAVLGGLAAGAAFARYRQPEPGAIDDFPVRKVPTRDLLRVVHRRGVRRLRRGLAGGRG
ncbi:hypothetical protein V1L54_14055 [Streptomyces sp. TRM 70361]|uniref:hypothetical protein n=1 Tax=Streptomyces sp. TRM 70361 TaxID=3116553 RepID=UPI002E7BC128|nr:hypothetical protein [Streptomyces sp. TRM 70361]MEE1940515.1 hypothetical protein [Streptomyces sp. TRM 70361]